MQSALEAEVKKVLANQSLVGPVGDGHNKNVFSNFSIKCE